MASKLFDVEHALGLYAHSFYCLPAEGIYSDDLNDKLGEGTKDCHIYLIGIVPEVDLKGARQAAWVIAIIGSRLPDPFVDRGSAGFILPRQTFNTAPSAHQRDHLIPKFRRVRVPRSRHNKHSPSSVKKCPSNRGNSKLYKRLPSKERLKVIGCNSY